MSPSGDVACVQENTHGSNDHQISPRSFARIECPSLTQILSELAPPSPALTFAATQSLPSEEQKVLFDSLRSSLKGAEEHGGLECFEAIPSILRTLWECKSLYLAPAAEALANGSRNAPWRVAYGQAGILDFFLQLIASKASVDDKLLLHAFRLIGNSCADTNENRDRVVKSNYTSAIVQHSSNLELIQVVIPVLYNTCIDYAPAQAQLGANKLLYVLLKLVKDGTLKGREALVDYVFELIELIGEQEKGITSSPDGTILLVVELALNKEITSTPAQSICLTNCLVSFLTNAHFQEICISNGMVTHVLAVLNQSLSFKAGHYSNDDDQALTQACLKTNQVLAEISASDSFADFYPIESPLIQTLKAWMTSREDQLQICSCVMLGNLARSDAVCEKMVRDFNIHQDLISILRSDANAAVLHSALGYLKNLAIAGDNRLIFGETGIISSISRLWQYDSVPQVQLAATSITRQVIISTIENISRLLEELPEEGDDLTPKRTYLSLLLKLFRKTDSTPIKTEIGRIVTSVCRTLVPKSREQDLAANDLLERVFDLHEDVALPVGAMVTQSQWPVVRSEGWFALALMASSNAGSAAVSRCLPDMGILPLIEQTLDVEFPEPTDETEATQLDKDRGNIVVLLQEILKNDPVTLPESSKATIQELVLIHISRQLRDGNPMPIA